MFKSIKIPFDLWKELKQVALDEETTMINIVKKSFSMYKDSK